MNKTCLLLLVVAFPCVLFGQPEGEAQPNPRGAFLRSLAFPGWGHHYVNSPDGSRGKIHAGAELALVFSYLGLKIHSNNLQQNWRAYARSEAGIRVGNKSRTIKLAVGDFNSLSAYNDFQLRARNWDRLIEDVPENRWRWVSDAERNRYNNLRSRFETIDQQLPALVGMMVVNRLISAVSAYNRAKKSQSQSSAMFYLGPPETSRGISAHLKVHF